MQRRWFRIRWADGEPARRAAVDVLDRVAHKADLSVAWIRLNGDLGLLVEAGGRAEALLSEGLLRCLPGARLVPESAGDVTALTDELGHGRVLWGPRPASPPFPDAVLELPTDGPVSAVLTWRASRLGVTLFTAQRMSGRAALEERWAGVRVMPTWARWAARIFGGAQLKPSHMLTLPSSEEFPMLASRKRAERMLSCSHSRGELLLGFDAKGREVWLPSPARLVWVGAPEGIRGPLRWMMRHWNGRVVVLDSDAGTVSAAAQDVAAIVVDWAQPERSDHVNPLMKIAGETADRHVARMGRWLRTLGVGPDVLGGRVWRGLLAVLKLMVLDGADPAPHALLGVFRNVQSFAAELEAVRSWLPPRDRAALDAVRWGEDGRALAAAESILLQVLDVPEMALWCPPYVGLERLQEADWLVIRAPAAAPAPRLYWDSLLPLLEALHADRADTLVVALSAGAVAGSALSWQGPCSVVGWGRSLQPAIGSDVVPPDVDLVSGAGADPRSVAPLLRVGAAALASQGADQAEARIGGDLGSLRLCLPSPSTGRPAGAWRTPSGEAFPAPLGIVGEEGEEILSALLQATLGPDERVLVLGRREALRAVWQAAGGDLSADLWTDDRPPVAPLASADVNAWIWWGQGLGIQASLLRSAHGEGVKSVRELIAYARERGPHARRTGTLLTSLEEMCASGAFGYQESEPARWLAEHPRLAIESTCGAESRALAMGALNAGARLVIVDAPGFVRSDVAMLRRVKALLCPAPPWIDTVLMWSPDGGGGDHAAVFRRRSSGEERRIRWRARA